MVRVQMSGEKIRSLQVQSQFVETGLEYIAALGTIHAGIDHQIAFIGGDGVGIDLLERIVGQRHDNAVEIGSYFFKHHNILHRAELKPSIG